MLLFLFLYSMKVLKYGIPITETNYELKIPAKHQFLNMKLFGGKHILNYLVDTESELESVFISIVKTGQKLDKKDFELGRWQFLASNMSVETGQQWHLFEVQGPQYFAFC